MRTPSTTMVNVIDAHDAILGRALAERFVATLFLREPDAGWLASLASGGLFDEFPVPVPTESPVGEALRSLAASCGRLAEGDSAEAAAIGADYERLFLGPGHVLAPPWESVYRSDEHLLFDRQTFEVREEYRLMGIRTAAPEIPDDHAGLELLYLAMLDERAADGDEDARAARGRFLHDHVLVWVPQWCADITQHALTTFWPAVARLTLEVVRGDGG